jgi:vitellogenic carboxypeptidase-like protein
MGYSGRKDNWIVRNTGLDFYYNILLATRPPDYDYYIKYVSQPQIRRALHVGNVKFDTGQKVMSLLRNDIMQSAKWKLEFLLNNGVRTLLYSGQLDLIVPNRATDEFIQKLEWYGLQGFLEKDRKIWRTNGQGVRGYFRNHLNFTRVTLRDCGHMVPYDKPKLAFHLIQAFVQGKFENWGRL